MKSSVVSAEILLLLVILIWGINFPLVKGILQQFSPLAFNALRFLMAASVLWLAAWLRGMDMRLTREETKQCAVLGLLGIAFYQVLFIEGIARTTAGNSALILSSSPIIVACSSHLLGRERLRLPAAAGAVLAFAGLYFVITGKQHAVAGYANIRGDLLTLAAACLWAIYTLALQSILKARSAFKVTAYATVLGTVPLLIWCAPALARQNWAQIDKTGWWGLLFSGLLSIGAAQLIWNYCVGKMGPTRASLYSNLTPVVALVAGAIFLKERVTLLQTMGAAATLAGVALARWQK